MLKIIVNDYLKNGKVVYENEDHNKMIIFGNKNGEEFKIKIDMPDMRSPRCISKFHTMQME